MTSGRGPVPAYSIVKSTEEVETNVQNYLSCGVVGTERHTDSLRIIWESGKTAVLK